VREADGGAGGGGLAKMLGGTLGGPGALSNAGALGEGRAYGTNAFVLRVTLVIAGDEKFVV
jgi:hypothetical protein